MQCVSGALSLVVKQPGREADHTPLSSAEVKSGGAIPQFPIRLHEVMLNKLSRGTNVLYLIYTRTHLRILTTS
jgi:hypothetical protein